MLDLSGTLRAFQGKVSDFDFVAQTCPNQKHHVFIAGQEQRDRDNPKSEKIPETLRP